MRYHRRVLRLSIIAALALVGCSDNLAPVFEPPLADRTLRVGERVQFAVRAVDRDGGGVRYAVRGLPLGATFDRDDAPPLFSWAPVASDGAAAGRPHPITFVATDEDGARTEARVLLTVYAGNTTPSFTSPSAYPLDLRLTETLDVVVTVRDDDSTRVHFELVEAPAGARLQPEAKQARLQWTPTVDQLSRRQVFGFTVNAWDEEPARTVTQVITVVVHD